MEVISLNSRLKTARVALNLTQTQFGKKLGVAAAAISKIEKGVNALTDQMILAICRAYPINEVWLRTGTGSMFAEKNADIIEQLAQEYDLDELDKRILEAFLKLPAARRAIATDFVVSLTNSLESENAESAENPKLDPAKKA